MKILIIKLGYSETLDPEIGRVPSLGDVLRTTPILYALREKFPESHITWFVSENAEPLLHKNPLINRVVVADQFSPFQLMREKFDVLINLEKIPGLCALSDMIDAWVKYGFRFDSLTGAYHAYECGLAFIDYIALKKEDRSKVYWQQALIEMLGMSWNNQNYIVGYVPKIPETFDIGFNYEVGSKWPNKGMDKTLWTELERRLSNKGFSISWQEGKNNLYDYMDWIGSCRMLITNDSLGMHLAFAFNKKSVCLFGPTDSSEVYFYPGSALIVSTVKCPQMPCMVSQCATGLDCMQHFDLSSIETAVMRLLEGGQS